MSPTMCQNTAGCEIRSMSTWKICRKKCQARATNQNVKTLHYDLKKQKESFSGICVKVHKEKPLLGGEPLKVLLPFAITYICDAGFSMLTVTKTKFRNRLQSEHDLRCNLSLTKPRFEEVARAFQSQGSH